MGPHRYGMAQRERMSVELTAEDVLDFIRHCLVILRELLEAGAPLPHLRRDWAHRCPHLRRDWAHRTNICRL